MAPHIIIAGGSGFLGSHLASSFAQYGYQITILSRQAHENSAGIEYVKWDGVQLGPWQKCLEGAAALINLSGKSVNCRYTAENRQAIHSSRVQSTRVLGEAIQLCKTPPKVWMNASTATIYRYSEDRDMTEAAGELVDDFSTSVAKAWEAAFFEVDCPHTRQIALRTSIVLAAQDGALPRLVNLARTGLGGAQGHGRQFVSWIHIEDWLRIVDWLIQTPTAKGVYNCTAPHPLPNHTFMRSLREVVRAPFGLPMSQGLLTFGAWLIGTETELILKSRRVIPERLIQEGFRFLYPEVKTALKALLQPPFQASERVMVL